ncbi:unnamed protein product [Symbiodinium necroappetens]|uniref:Uncharacterized protein n=1 Tax=Symbiodinium necroappetens TaxID=1628268 RepID=A0A812V252_9DINO|nr:unnamed protein product [Symbiodinium necroappetens]
MEPLAKRAKLGDDGGIELHEVQCHGDVKDLLRWMGHGGLIHVTLAMSQDIGFNWQSLHPKIAVQLFFLRYCGLKMGMEAQYEYICDTVAWPESGYVATLVTRGFYDRRFSFRGKVRQTIAAAETSVAQVFLSHPSIIEIASRLPPPLPDVRHRLLLTKPQREALAAAGLSWEAVQEDMVQKVYFGFQSMGCRSQLWDASAA